MADKSPFVVSPDWLEAHLDDAGLAIVDASWYLPAQKRDARAEHDAAHIPGAVFFDQDQVVDPESALPHALPSPAAFERHAGAMGIARDDTIVVHDGPGMFAAPRVWWMFRIMGAPNVFVLDGGFDNWRADGRPVTDAPTRVAEAAFVTKADMDAVVFLDAMRQLVDDGTAQIADARGPGRFSGEEPEPRAGMRAGHMPGARNLHYAALSDNGYLKDLDGLRAAFAGAGIDPDRPVVASCGSGVTAAVIDLALASLGAPDHRLYDGSWAEWGGREDTPVATGPAGG